MKKAVIFDMYGVLLLRNMLFIEHEHTTMTELLKEIKEKGMKLFLLSNIYIHDGDHYKDKYPFLKLFDQLYFSSDTKLLKPDPRAYELVLKENNLKAEECFFFDDTPRNVEAAKALGMEAYVFESADAVREKLR